MKKYNFLILLLILFVSRIPKIILNTLIDRMLKLDDTLIIKRNGKQYNSNNS